MQYLFQRKILIHTLEDLVDWPIYKGLGKTLLKAFDELIFTDFSICLKQITCSKSRSIFQKYSNSKNWNILREEQNSKQFNRQLSRFRHLVNMFSPDNIQFVTSKLIQAKWKILHGDVPLLPLSKKQNLSSYYIKVSQKKETRVIKQCLTCGRDISSQKSTSKYCSEKMFGSAVKRCRNIISNLRRDELKKYPSETLFDVDQFLNDNYRRWKNVAIKQSYNSHSIS